MAGAQVAGHSAGRDGIRFAGVNLPAAEGALTNHRLAAEVIVPLYQDFNGAQLEQNGSVIVGWQP